MLCVLTPFLVIFYPGYLPDIVGELGENACAEIQIADQASQNWK